MEREKTACAVAMRPRCRCFAAVAVAGAAGLKKCGRSQKKHPPHTKISSYYYLLFNLFSFLDFILDCSDVPTLTGRVLATGSTEMHISNSTCSIWN